MKKVPLLKEAVQPRLDGIQKNLVNLEEFGSLPFSEFKKPEVIERVHYHIRLALEGVFHITSHILSRIPGARETEYKRMAVKLGEVGVVDEKYANTVLVAMAGYRNRLTHFYSEVKAKELYDICNNKLGDIESFLKSVKKLMKNPKKFTLTVE